MFRDRKRFACLRGRATLGDVENAISGQVEHDPAPAPAARAG
jgi:hypothetical protein